MKQLQVTRLLILAAAMFGATAMAEPSDSADNGRFQLHQGHLEGGQEASTLLIDTQLGRVWVMKPDTTYGAAFVRVPLLRIDKLNDGYQLRPPPPKPTAKGADGN